MMPSEFRPWLKLVSHSIAIEKVKHMYLYATIIGSYHYGFQRNS